MTQPAVAVASGTSAMTTTPSQPIAPTSTDSPSDPLTTSRADQPGASSTLPSSSSPTKPTETLQTQSGGGSSPVIESNPNHPLESGAAATAGAEGEGAQSNQDGSNNPSQEPMCHVRALIISGDNHVFSFEPEMTVGRMKELIWSMWPSQWTEPAQPPSPSFLRILYAGRILSDESTLASNNLPIAVQPTIPTVIHISVRSFSLRPEDDPQKGSLLHPVGSRNRNGRNDDVGGCKCTIM